MSEQVLHESAMECTSRIGCPHPVECKRRGRCFDEITLPPAKGLRHRDHIEVIYSEERGRVTKFKASGSQHDLAKWLAKLARQMAIVAGDDHA